jgi:hypothetical protein
MGEWGYSSSLVESITVVWAIATALNSTMLIRVQRECAHGNVLSHPTKLTLCVIVNRLACYNG